MKQGIFKNLNSGFTLIEIIVASAVGIGVTLLITVFFSDVVNFKGLLMPNLEVQQEINQTFQEMILEIRSMGQSSVGGYPIASASTSTLVFYSDIDSDGLYEQIRYFLENGVLKKGLIKPSGNPLVYSSADEKISEVIHNFYLQTSTSTIFKYYDENYTGSESAMSYPIDISQIRLIEVGLSGKQSNQKSSINMSSKILPRNLRTNL